MVKIIDFIFAARPMLLLPVWSLYLIADNFYFGSDSFDRYDFIVLAGLTFLVAGAYYINQIYDYQSDLINKKLGFLQTGKISRNEMTIMYIVLSAISIATGFILNWFLGTIFSLIFILGYIYSAPPLRLKDRPLSGLLANSIAYGVLVPLSLPGFAENADYLAMIMPTYFFMTVSAAYLLTVIPDREGDQRSGKQTLAVILSDRSLIMVAIVFLVFSLLLAREMNHLFLIVISSVSLLLYAITLFSPKKDSVLLACKFPILLMSLLAGYYYPGYLVFLLALLIFTRLYYKKRFGILYPRIK
ncbi:MAG: hypothetical protein DRP51_08885 [Candidatus Zixiibacteriota bacterium]|nr:MAG: hypothetical protein DRP51_08885 [candidate division Zixibacteria bacterium]HHI02117.1 hypothetical protein [candidate division Zixibacteria bacterium]